MVLRRPLLPTAVLVGVALAGTPSLNHNTVGVVYMLVTSSTWPTRKLREAVSPASYPVLLSGIGKPPVMALSFSMI